MNITDIRVRRITAEGRMKAVVSVTFDDAFVVHDIKVIEGQDRLFIAMPSRKVADDRYEDIAHPINAETRKLFEDAILEEFQEMMTAQNFITSGGIDYARELLEKSLGSQKAIDIINRLTSSLQVRPFDK